MNKISVITCAYNSAKFLEESLDSIISQVDQDGNPFRDFQLVLVDDGSTDDITWQILFDYYKRIKKDDLLSSVVLLKNHENVGVPLARTAAIVESKNFLIAVHDSDDISYPHRLSAELKVFEENPKTDMVGSHATKIDEFGNELEKNMDYPPISTDEMYSLIWSRRLLNPFIDPSIVIKRSTFINSGGYNLEEPYRLVQDFELVCRWLWQDRVLTNLQIPLVKYRVHEGSLTHQKQKTMLAATSFVRNELRTHKLTDVKFDPTVVEGLYQKI